MSRNTIEINGQVIPLPAGSVLAINYRAHDIRNLASWDGSYAETLTLPDTNLTRRAMENSHLITSAAGTPYKAMPATLKHKGNAVLSGIATHTEVSEGYAVNVDGQNAGVFVKIKGKALSEIVLNDLDHTYTAAAVAGANTHDPERGYVYPLINYGLWTSRFYDPTNQNFTELFPAVYVRTLLERMLAPYTLAGSLLDEERFEKLVLPFTNTHFLYRDSYVENWTSKVNLSTSQAINPTLLILFDQVISDPEGMYDLGNYRMNLPLHGNYQATGTLYADVDLDSDPGSFAKVVVRLHRGALEETIQEIPLNDGAGQIAEINTGVLNATPGSYLTVWLETDSNTFATVHAGTNLTVNLSREVYPGGPVHLERNLPDLSQEDLLVEVASRFNLQIQVDELSGTVWLDLLQDITEAQPVDWSRKVDWKDKPRTVFALDGYARRNVFASEPLEYPGKEGKQQPDSMALVVLNENLEPEKKAYTSPFASTEELPAFWGALTLPYIPLFAQQVKSYGMYRDIVPYGEEDYLYYGGIYWRSTVEQTGVPPGYTASTWALTLEDEVFKRNEPAPRLLVLTERAVSQAVPVGDNAPGGTYADLRGSASYLPITWETLRLAYHGITELMLTQSRILTLNVRLKLPDISTLDFLRPVMLNVPVKNMQGVFYLNAVNQWNPEAASTEIELVRLFGLPLFAEPIETGHLEFSEEFSEEFN